MKLVIFSKNKIQGHPLVISLANAAKNIGYDIIIVTQNIDNEVNEKLKEVGFIIYSLSNKEYNNKFFKILHWYKFSRFANRIYKSIDNSDKIWITSTDTAIAMGSKVLKTKPFYFQISELYDDNSFYLKQLKKITKYSKVNVVPEKNRGAIFQVWFNLQKMPSILPNKPYFDEDIIAQGEDIYFEHIRCIKEEKKKGKKIFLYQGNMGGDRDISPILENLNKKENIFTILMGNDFGILEKYKKINPKLYYIPHIPAPFYLSITKYADIGLLTYLPINLNNIYCAPSKLWEYTKYGLAILGNNIIGLDYITNLKIGEQCNINDKSDVNTKLNLLIDNFDIYSNNSKSFYNSFNFEKELKSILDN